MTGHQINSLVGDLVAMAQAMERLPQVERDLELANSMMSQQADVIQSREIRILELKADIEALQIKLREAEVAKDSAETMFLEADDRTGRALDFVKTMFGSAGSLIQALEPVKAMPQTVSSVDHALFNGGAQPDAPTTIFDSQREADPIPQASHEADYSSGTGEEFQSIPQGQSELDPTVSMQTQDASTQMMEHSTSMSGSEEHPPQVDDPNLSAQDDLEPTRYDDFGNTRDAWFEWARRTGYWDKRNFG